MRTRKGENKRIAEGKNRIIAGERRGNENQEGRIGELQGEKTVELHGEERGNENQEGRKQNCKEEKTENENWKGRK